MSDMKLKLTGYLKEILQRNIQAINWDNKPRINSKRLSADFRQAT